MRPTSERFGAAVRGGIGGRVCHRRNGSRGHISGIDKDSPPLKTGWKMTEYKLSKTKDRFVMCCLSYDQTREEYHEDAAPDPTVPLQLSSSSSRSHSLTSSSRTHSPSVNHPSPSAANHPQTTDVLKLLPTSSTCLTDAATFIQGAIPDIIGNTKQEFFSSKLEMVRECAEICYEEILKIPCVTCPCKPEGSMFTMVKLNLSLLEDISDDLDFCSKLAKEESMIILPGRAVGLKNWLRITFAVELDLLIDGFSRLKNFAQRHSKKQP